MIALELPDGTILTAVPADPESGYYLTQLDGFDGVDLRQSASDLPDRDGAQGGPVFRTARTITMTVTIVGTDRLDADARLAVLRRAMRPVSAPWPLLVHGRTPGPNTLTIDVRPSQPFAHTHGDGWDRRIRSCQMAVTAPDPRFYDVDWQTATVHPPGPSGGITWPITWPINWSGSAYMGTPVIADGDDQTPPILTVFGPITDPVLSNATTGESIVLTGTVGPNETLVVDPLARTVLLDGDPSQSRYHWVDGALTRWWLLAPGANQIGLLGSGTDGNSRLGILWRNSWL